MIINNKHIAFLIMTSFFLMSCMDKEKSSVKIPSEVEQTSQNPEEITVSKEQFKSEDLELTGFF